ncbi:MAG: apolipoprotein N-acyltransferase [Candidatus Stygibacter australis]|nr:apolipoprotein N-acyltransferase [Candidatus Stygibacter australis]MDP8321201.1 apolipoprotein N-acyltransferase [Candidatus Stygibacter australis]
MKNIQINKILLLPFLAALLTGIARLPIHLGFISYCGFIPLLFFFDRKPSYRVINQGAFVFSFVYTITALHWITLVTLPGFVGMILLFYLYFLIIFHLNNVIWIRNHKFRFLGFLLLWLAFEHLLNYGQFSFPWFYTGYSLADYNILLQPAEIGGVTLISLYVILTNILIYQFVVIGKKSPIIWLLAIHLIWVGYSNWRYHTIKLENTHRRAGIVQISIPQNLKWKSAYRDTTFNLYDEYIGKLSDETDMAILPESAIPGYVMRRFVFKNFVNRMVKKHKKAIFTGFPDYIYDAENDEALYYNSCNLFDSTGYAYKPYYKKILVPFGERIPLLNVMPVLNRVELGQANWEYGKELRYYEYEGLKFTPQICFEVAFPDINVQMASNDPVFIVNLTNDAWFYHSAGTYQHAMMTRFRAIETRTQYFRSANTGISLIVNPRGDILAKTDIFTRETIEADIYDYQGKSLFVRYFHIFPNILIGLLVLLLLWSLIKKD